MPKHMAVIYTNSVPLAVVYPNIHHFLYLANMNPTNLYVNFWDSYANEFFMFDKLGGENKIKTLQENIDAFKKIVTNKKINAHYFTYSETIQRLIRDRDYYALLQKILAKITVYDINYNLEIQPHVFEEITVSNLINIVADYLIAAFLDKLYPEIKLKKPDIYFTGPRFKAFFPIIESILRKEYLGISLPQPIYITFPFVRCPKTKMVPGIQMGYNEIHNIFSNFYEQKDLTIKEMESFTEILGLEIEKFKFKKHLIGKKEFLSKLKICGKEIAIELLVQNFVEYFYKIESILYTTENKTERKPLLVDDELKFKQKIKPLNSLKLKILTRCNGQNSSMDIAKEFDMNLSTVSAYIGSLKKIGLITDEHKPLRKVDSILINLEKN